MYIKISDTFPRIPDTQSRVITKVYEFLGQPSYYRQKVSPKQSAEDDSNPAGVCVKCFDYMLLWAGLQSIESR